MVFRKKSKSPSSDEEDSDRKQTLQKKPTVEFKEPPSSNLDDEELLPVEKGVKYDTDMSKEALEYYYDKPKIPSVRRSEKSLTITEKNDDPPPIIHTDNFEPRKERFYSFSGSFEEKPSTWDYIMIYVILGYLTGIVLIFFWYFLNFKKASSNLHFTWFFLVFLVLLLLIIFHNRTTRSFGAVAIPLLSGYRGQVLFMAFAFVLCVTGPLMNIILNVEIMMHTLCCGHGLLRSALTPMHEIMGAPVFALEEAVYYCLKQVRRVMKTLDSALKHLEEPIDKWHAAYRSCEVWLEHQQTYFDGVMSSPYDRCLAAGSKSARECVFRFKDQKGTTCNLKQRFEWFCENLKGVPSFFDAHLQEKQLAIEQIFKPPFEATAKIRRMFEVSITFDHNINSTVNRSHLHNELEREISQKMESYLKYFNLLLLYSEFLMFLMIVLIILRTIYFRWSYLGSNSFKNIYLTKDFMDYNRKMEAKYGKNDLPMLAITKKNFGYLDSLRILPVEIGYMARTLVFLIYSSLQLFTICFVDYCLFWMLAMISYHVHQTADLQPPVYMKLVIKKGGFIGDILRGLVYAFEPLSKNLVVDIQRCLPLPRPPRYVRYWAIMIFCILAWLMLMVEPYILRLRHRILDKMYQKNAEQRSAFMYRYLQIDKETFIKPARRRARSKNSYYYENNITHIIIWYRGFLYRISCGHCGSYMGRYCITCHTKLTEKNYVNCDTVGCRGVYCQWCFLESNCHCILCSLRIKYLDFSDISDVEDSSDDPTSQPYRQDNIYCNDRQKKA